MGLAASQGRYLCLTARMSDLVYEGQQISQQRLILANQAKAAADKYNEAMSNRVIQANIMDENGNISHPQLTYEILTNKDPFSGLGMRIVDLDGNVVVPKRAFTLEASYKDEEGNDVSEKFQSSAQFITKYMTNLSGDEANEMGSWDLPKLAEYYKQHYSDSNLTLNVTDNIDTSLKNENEHFLYDENLSDPAYLQQMLTSGQWLLQQANPSKESGWDDAIWQGSTKVSDVLDTSDDAAAEAEYEAAMVDIQKKDKLFELRLEQVQTEESAVEKELDSVKQVINDNVEKSFGTFA